MNRAELHGPHFSHAQTMRHINDYLIILRFCGARRGGGVIQPHASLWMRTSDIPTYLPEETGFLKDMHTHTSV